MTKTEDKLSTKNKITWCPGCYDFFILAAVKKVLARLIESGKRQKDFTMVAGIGCHAKIFDYLNISGFYGLHGRVLPTALGIKIGNPKLTVIGFSGDGDSYAEGMEHFIHAGRYNADITLLVFDNQNFALTTGQSAPTSQQGFRSKVYPLGDPHEPINPIKLALASGATFVARTYSKDVNLTAEIIEKAIRHKGFSFIEILQPCLQFNLFSTKVENLMHKVNNGNDMKKAMKLAEAWNYSTNEGKIALGILYQHKTKTFEEKYGIK